MTGGDIDVLVVGGGGAGLAAALAAVEDGASQVVVLEAAEEPGGTTAVSAGSMLAAGTPRQAADGWLGDTAEAMLDHFLTASAFDADVGVVHELCRGAAPTLEWLLGHGARLAPDGLNRAGRETAPRSHRFAGQGKGLTDVLVAGATRAGVRIRCGERVRGLALDHDTVVGVRTDAASIAAGAVVLATGGFAHDAELMRRHLGDDVAWPGAGATSPAVATARGDGLRMAMAAGCGTAARGGTVRRLAPSFPAGDLYLPPWLLLVDGRGARFVDESAPPQAFADALSGRGGRCWAVFDEPGRAVFGAPRQGLVRGVSWADTLADQLTAGRIVSAPDPHALADLIGADRATLAATTARYSAAVRAGADIDFEKSAAHLRPVDTAPLYATELRPHVVLITGVGVEIERDAAVRRADGTVLPGLFAAGEVTGNGVGARYPAQGAAITNALVFGRIAGRSAARYAAAAS